MTRTVSLYQFMPYGAPELQSVARRYMLRALLLSSVLYTLLFAAGGLLQRFTGAGALAPAPTAIPINILTPPPTLLRYQPIASVPPVGVTRVSMGVPVPVPDEKVPISPTIPDQAQLRAIAPGIEAGERPLVVEEPAPPAAQPEWARYVYVEELPEPVRTVSPDYPTLAHEAGVSGLVLAHALVGRDGRVHDVQIDPEHSIPLLNEAAEQALRQWVFKPALLNSRPMEVWVTVPFNFSLQ